MKKICFLIGDINHSGGTERVTTLIANELAEKNKVYILSLSGGTPPFFEQHSSIINESLFNEKVSMKKKLLIVISKIRKYLITNKIDTLIVVDSISCVFTVPACIGLKLQHICWEHFNLKVNLGSQFRDLGRWMAAKWCTKIVTLTERDKNFWVEKYTNVVNKITIISNPSPYLNIKHTPSLNNKIVLSIGRLDYIKGFDLLLEAWSHFCKEEKEWILNIVGGGEEEGHLKQMAKDLGISSRVAFLGQQKNVDQFYRKASIYCLSSRNEGLPMVLLEAQSYGLPIIAFDCDTGPAEIIKDSENGYLCENGNSLELVYAIRKVISKKECYDSFSKSAFVNSKRFEVDFIGKKWQDLLNNEFNS